MLTISYQQFDAVMRAYHNLPVKSHNNRHETKHLIYTVTENRGVIVETQPFTSPKYIAQLKRALHII
jgi:hypothetical protein